MSLQDSQIQDIFNSKVNRMPSPEELQKFRNASFDNISQLGKVDYNQYPKGDSSSASPTSPNQGSISNAVLPNQTPAPAPTEQQPSVQAPTAETNAATAASLVSEDSKAALTQAQSEYTGYQHQVQAIDKALTDSYANKKAEIERQGGIVNETQLRAQVANEQAPLLSQRKQLASSQATAGQNLNKVQSYHQQQLMQSQRLAQAAQIAQSKQAQQMTIQGQNLGIKQAGIDIQKSRLSNSVAASEVTPELSAAITAGSIDPARINSRTIKMYNELAKLGVDAVASSLTAKNRSQIVSQASKYQVQAQQMAGILEKNMPTLIELARKVNPKNVDSQAIDAAWIKGTKYFSQDPDIAGYTTALINARTEYANLVSRGGVVTESSRAEAVTAIPAGYSPEQYQAVLDVELKNAKNTYESSQDIINAAKENRSVYDTSSKEKTSSGKESSGSDFDF